ncbi:MAG TPA: hypothetical protein DDX81_12860 [Desulfofustis sp.]|jgi:hypothetical protein|nr:hypothetical protein [Desulfofustis sp.]
MVFSYNIEICEEFISFFMRSDLTGYKQILRINGTVIREGSRKKIITFLLFDKQSIEKNFT